MKAKLTFQLPEDQYEYDAAVKSIDLLCALIDIEQELRKKWKYDDLNDDEFKIVEELRNKFYEIVNDYNIKLNG